MLTILEVIEEKPVTFKDKMTALIKPYSIQSAVRNSGGINVLTLSYIHRRGFMHTEKLYKYCIGATKHILCDKQVPLKASHLERFESNALTEKLMENFLLDILSTNDTTAAGLNIGFYDPEAEYPSFAEKLLGCCSSMTVVSFMPKFYEIEANRILRESGAVLTASNSLEQLSHCDMIISPGKIKRPLPTRQNTVIFTVCSPSVHMPGILITGYDVEIPEEYAALKPDCIDTDYFLSGLYSLCTVTALADLQPSSCHTDTVCFSADDTLHLVLKDSNNRSFP